ncbi:MAG: hypothetical protein HGA45_33720 [Chloroflexales bacterium]|nr:hypothetical protein [Chloroflexales bacterium]
MATTALEGVQFTADAAGSRSTTQASKAIYSAALEHVDPRAAQAVRDERKWRTNYPRHLHALTRAGIASPEHALTIASDGLAAAWGQFELLRGGGASPFAEAMRRPEPDALTTVTVQGQGPPAPEPWSLPYRGRLLRGSELRDQIARWEQEGIIEPSHARALGQVIAHPEWFDLSDRTLVLLGAASEAGPLAALARWRANIVAVDLPRPATWQKIVQTVTQGNARLLAPLDRAGRGADPGGQGASLAGANLLTQAPEIAAWLMTLDTPLDIAALAYLDGEQHVRVSLAMDGIIAGVSAERPDTTLMYMATPADVFAVPEDLARAAMRNATERSQLRHVADGVVRALSGGRLLRPHVEGLVTSENGRCYGIVDGVVVEQGPNYALAKRLQQWRAVAARAGGQRVAINVTPSTMTQSVLKNPALKAGYNGAGSFGIEVFEPATTSALMAALWVHDLRCGSCAAEPTYPLAHPLELLMDGANHGGLWRLGYLPRSALPLAALIGYGRGILRRS